MVKVGRAAVGNQLQVLGPQRGRQLGPHGSGFSSARHARDELRPSEMNPAMTLLYGAGLTVTVCTGGFEFDHFQGGLIPARGTLTWSASFDRRPPVCYEACSS